MTPLSSGEILAAKTVTVEHTRSGTIKIKYQKILCKREQVNVNGNYEAPLRFVAVRFDTTQKQSRDFR